MSDNRVESQIDAEGENVEANESNMENSVISTGEMNHSAEEEADEDLEEGEEKDAELEEGEEEVATAAKKKMRRKKSTHGTSFIEIPGTPIVSNLSGIDYLPTSEKFSANICEHKPFDMVDQTPKGSYQNIVKLTREFKASVNQPKFD